MASPVCCELQEVDTTGWRRQQEEDADLRPVLQWVDLQQRPPWEEVAVLSLVPKEMWAKFEALWLWDGMLQRAWKEPATGEVRCLTLRVGKGSKRSMVLWARGTLG